jgi:hypothetical protein
MALLQWATPTVALGPAAESVLAHMGLSAREEAGELPPPPHSSAARSSPIESGRPATSGRGRRCQGDSPGGEGPNLGHRWRRVSPWWAHSGGAGRQWGTGDGGPEKRWRKPARGSWSGGELGRRSLWQTKEVASSVLQRFLTEDSGSTAGLAWLRGARERCVVASARRLE